MNRPTAPRFSVIIPTFQRCEVVVASVRALARQTFKDFETIVVVDGSSDGSAEALRSLDLPFPLNVVEQPNLGLSSARNRGAREVSGEILLFLDDDMEADQELLAAHDRSHRAGEEIVLGHFPLHPDSPPTFLASGVKYWADERARRLACPGAQLTPFDLICGQISIRSDLFRALGGFDEAFTRDGTYGNEDLEFGARAIASGCKIVFNPYAISRQRYVVGFRQFLDQYRDRGRADVELTRKRPLLADAFDIRGHSWPDRLLFKPLATLPLLGKGLTRACASLGLAIAERNPRSKIAARLFWPGRQMIYWRSVAKSRGFEPRRGVSAERLEAQRLTLREAVRAVSPEFVVKMVRRSKAAARQLRRLRPLLAPGPAILMYHRVAEESFDPFGLAVSPANFAEQIEWIARNRTPLPLPEFAELNRQGRLPRDAVAVTFDDGYSCNRAAKTLLERFQVPATVFIPAELIECGREFWWDELERIVLGHARATLRLDGREIRLGEAEPGDRQWAQGQPPRTERQQACNQLWSILYKMGPRELAEAMKDLREQANVAHTLRDSHRPLTVEELRGMQSEFVEFGSHALSHTSLPLLSSDEKAGEIGRSMARCAEITGVWPRSFSYPYGDSDPETERLVEEAGFSCACKSTGWFVTRSSNRFALPRIAVGNWDSARLARELGRP